MAQSLGMLEVGFTADLSGLQSQLNQATSAIRSTLTQMGNAMTAAEAQAKSWFTSLRNGAMSIGSGLISASGVVAQASTNIRASIIALGGDFVKAEAFAKTFFRTVRMLAIVTAGAMIAASAQGQHFMEAMGALSQYTVDQTVGPTIERWANGIERLVRLMREFGTLQGFDKAFSQETKMQILGIAGAITGVLLFALNAMNITLWATAQALWATLLPMLPWMAAGAAVATVAYLIWQNWGQLIAWINSAFPGLTTTISIVFNTILAIVKTVLHLIWAVFKTVLLAIWAVVSTVFNTILQTIIAVLRGAWAFIRSIFQAIKIVIQTSMQLIKAIMTGDWNAVGQILSNAGRKLLQIGKELFSNLGRAVSDGLSAIKGYFSSIINSVIGIWQSLYSSVASIWNKISSLWGKSNTMKAQMKVTADQSIATGNGKLRMLATGGIVTGPTMAMVGEGRYKEAVLPLSKSTYSALADGITSKMSGGNSGSAIIIQNMSVREEADITRIAEKLHRLQTIQNRAGGIV